MVSMMKRNTKNILWIQSGLNRRILKYVLDSAGIMNPNLSLASNLTDALSLPKEPVPDVILLDLYLSDGEGLEPIRRVLDAFVGVPVIIVTNLGNDVVARRARQMGVVDYFVLGNIDFMQLGHAIESAGDVVTAPKKKSFFRRLIGA